ncbi:MAG: hypothetical protein O3A55_04765 [Bacteroidetes bacterium]|nr:hypothetical protein [Bacteroidota bacterium]
MKIVSKTLEAFGIAALMIALVVGVQGDQWGEYYLFIGGIIAFFSGWFLERIFIKK